MTMTHTRTPRRKRWLAGAGAVTLAGAVLTVGSPAQAQSDELVYECNTLLGSKEFLTVSDTNLPATLPYGASVPVVNTASVQVPADLTGLVYGFLGGRTADGTATVDALVNGAPITFESVIETTEVPATGALVVDAVGSLPDFEATKMGVNTIAAGAYVADIVFYTEDGTEAVTSNAGCMPKTVNHNGTPDDTSDDTPFVQDMTVDRVTVVKDATKSKTSATYAKTQKKAVASSKVVAAHGTSATGKVKFVLKRNGKTVKAVTVSVNKQGVAKTAFTKITKKGKYAVVATYTGSKTLKASKGTKTFSVR